MSNPATDDRISVLKKREKYRDDYRARHDPISDHRLLWRAQSLRHLVHLVPGQSILEIGAGDLRFSRKLAEVSRGENPITAASFSNDSVDIGDDNFEHIFLDSLPGSLKGRQYDVVVALDILDSNECASILSDIHDLLVPGGEVIFFETNPWNPWLKTKQFLKKIFGREDPRKLLGQRRLNELLSEVGFIRVFSVFTDFVYAPLTPFLISVLRNLSIILENTPLVKNFAGTILLHAQRPPRTKTQPKVSLTDHPQFSKAVSVVIPCYNEEMNIATLIDLILEMFGDYIHEIVPVDDNSKDDTAKIIASYAENDSRIRPVYRSAPNGVGRAITDGIKATTGDWVLSMDCDFQHLLPEIRDMFDYAAAGAPVVVGSRFSRHSVLLNYPVGKIISNRGFHFLANILMFQHFRDVTNNLKLLHRDVVDQLQLTSTGFSVNAETGLQPLLMGYEVAESPISWINRSFDMGQSSFKLVTVGSGYIGVLWNIIRARMFDSGPYRKINNIAKSNKPQV